jgi:hypothetical protein
MTHVKNAEAFARLVDFCTGYGGSYNPGRSTLRMDALVNQKQEVALALNSVISAKTLFDNAVNQRKQVFDQLTRVIASVMRLLEASGASTEKLEDARAYVHQIKGYVVRVRPAVPSPEAQALDPAIQVPGRARLQTSYASKADWFARLVDAVATEPMYQANEQQLSVAGLTEMLSQLKAQNQLVSAARVAWSNAMISRNKVLYERDHSLYTTAVAVKKYVRAIFGHDSEQYAQVKTLSLTKPHKR